MKKYEYSMLGLLLVSLSTYGLPAVAQTSFLGPTEYLCFDDANTIATGACQGNDSPFKDGNFDYFHLDDMEDGTFVTPITAPGVSATADCTGYGGSNCPFLSHEVFPPTGTDSVDEDNGAIDGSGATTLGGGQALWARGSIIFEFNEQVLGGLPTHVGVVWTDGGGTAYFEAFDAVGISLGVISGVHADGVFTGTTGEDRFYGVINSGGISKIRISNTASGIEADHLQFGKEFIDSDGDGFSPPADCNDNDASINTSAFEITGNYVDENCNGDLGACSPCEDWRNHGAFVRCVAHEAQFLPEDLADGLVSSAAQTQIGKKGFVPAECP